MEFIPCAINNTMNNISDILYPECHLDSPIVTGKLVSLLLRADLPCHQPIDDSTLVKNLSFRINSCRRNRNDIRLLEFGRMFKEKNPNYKKYRYIPYPYGNKELFNIYSNDYNKELYGVISYANLCYHKISEKLINLRNNVEMTLNSNEGRENEIKVDIGIKNLPGVMESSHWFKPFLTWFTIKKQLRDMIKTGRHVNNQHNFPVMLFECDKLYIQMTRDLVIIFIRECQQVHYLTFEMVLLFSDVIEGRLMVDTAMSLDERYSQFQHHGRLLWVTIDNLFCDLGNNTYNIVAQIEPLVLGFLQLRDESVLLRGAFLNYCLKDMLGELKDLGFDHQDDLNEFLGIIYKIFSIDDIHMVGEFFSFFRTFGHPTLEASEAAGKVREHMNKPKLVNFTTMMKGHALFCGTIINGYRDQHGGAWPPLIFPEHVSKRVKNCWLNNESLTDEMCINNWKSFVGFKFKCFLPLVLDEDLTMYMKDKALAAIKSEWDSVYPKENMCYEPPKQTTSRRLVEVFLDDSNFDPYRLIQYVVSGEYLEDSEFNLSYSLKEKEIKRVGRLFAKMTYKMRACQVVAESLIASGVGKYFKENGMVKDEHELLKTLHKLSVSSVPRNNKKGCQNQHYNRKMMYTSMRKYKSLIRYSQVKKNDSKDDSNLAYETVSTFLTTDLQKFCLNWRQETTAIFAERLNEIYGLPNFFNWLHQRLEKSTLYVSDPHCPPYNVEHIDLDEVDNTQIFIKYPMGGIEGYCQKMWTIITIPFLFLSAYESGAKIAAVVQGDNQAIAITKRVHPNLPFRYKKYICSQLAQVYFNRLRTNMNAIGHNLKANETIVSSHFFIYSKRIYYDGLVLSQALKPMSRVVFWSETIVDETRSACSNISTAISKSIEQGYSRWLGYSINVLKTLQQVAISLKFTINPSMTKDIVTPIFHDTSWLNCCSTLPSQLGGFSYLNISRLYVRNIGDPLTAALADLKRLIKAGVLYENMLQKVIHQDAGQADYLDWASDPYSVNLPNSQSITTVLKNITSRNILQNSDNPMLRGLFHFDFEQEDRDLAKYLLDRPIIMPRAAHEIMDNSLTGARQEIAGMLDTTKGLIRNGLRLAGIRPRLVDKISLYDYDQFRIFERLMNVRYVDPLITINACSVRLAIALRKKMWMHLTHGRTIYGLEVPDTIECVRGYEIKGCEDCYFCSNHSKEYCWFFVPKFCDLDRVFTESNSIRVPYFGSTTDERSEIKLSTVRSASRALRAAIRIATVYTWAFGDKDQQWEEAWYLASLRANITIDELKAITPISTSNNIAHRLRDKSTQMKYSGSSLNRVSRYTLISNDRLNFIVNGVKIDTNLIYQQIMLLGLSILEDKFRFLKNTGDYNTVLHLHVVPNCCVIEMSEHPYLESYSILPVLHEVKSNPLVYDSNPIIDKDINNIYQQIYKQGSVDFPIWNTKQLETVLAQSLAMTLIEIITKEDKDHLTEFKVLSNDDNINSLITDFLLVDPNQLMLYTGLTIAVNWGYNIYYRRPEGKYQMIECVNTILMTTSRSYFNILANAFSHPKVFEKFWLAGIFEPIYGPNILSQDFIKLSIDFLVKSYSVYLDYWLDDNDINYLLLEYKDDCLDQRYEIIQSKHLCMLNNLYNTRIHMPTIRGLTSIEKCHVLTEALENKRISEFSHYNWNLDAIEVTIYPVSLTYLRRGVIKHIRLRKSLLGDDSEIRLAQWDPLNKKSHVIERNIKISSNGYSLILDPLILFSDDFRQLTNIAEPRIVTNRWEAHVMRRVGVNSTSCYKAIDIVVEILSINGTLQIGMFLGEGSGAMMTVYIEMLNLEKVYYNTGVYSEEALGQRVLAVEPSEFGLVCRNNMSSRVGLDNIHILFNGRPESTWIGNPECYQYIMNSIKHKSVNFIHNDMESNPEKTKDLILVEHIHSMCLALNLGTQDSIYVCKLAPYQGDFSRIIIHLLFRYYNDVKLFIPSYSNPFSTEIYLICHTPKSTALLHPDSIMSVVDMDNPKRNKICSFHSNILDLKTKNYLDMKRNLRIGGDYLSSDLTELSDYDKTLLKIGFQINGPKIIKHLTGYDVGSGSSALRSSINSLVNTIINSYDQMRDTTVFFDPFPLKKDSKINEIKRMLALKLFVYVILYCRSKEDSIRSNMLYNLRRKRIIFDLLNENISHIITNYLQRKLKDIKINTFVDIYLKTNIVKSLWKIVGYSCVFMTSDSG
ncbi:RNA-dependent RNA polymerase [Jeilongvirus chaetodipodis]|uniref:RNA-dependent RNA polymerase n=1 Tax=Paramyxoviridae sp. TaxID=1663356 RepID=A0AC61TPJ9_9MONO|nr:RNA-dependent RNA polymerase [Paramyxoviridae sp.]